MIKLTERTLNIIDLLVRHSFHYWIWTFCALFLVFDKVLHMPLELLNHFNFIPDFIINLSKILNTKPVEATIPEIHVIPANNDEIIVVLKESISLLQQEFNSLNNKFEKLVIIIQDNNVLLQNQITYQKELFSMINQKLDNFTLTIDTLKIDISTQMQDIVKVTRLQASGQLEIAHKIISNINENKILLTTLNSNILNLDKSILSLDISTPLLSIQDVLNQVVLNQKDLQIVYQNTQTSNLQSFNSILEMQNQGFQAMEVNLQEIFSKIHEVRNHNLGLHQQVIKSIDIKLLEQQTEIVNQVIDEINRPKTSSTQVSSNTSKFGFFNKK